MTKTEAKQRAAERLRLTAIGQSVASQHDDRLGEAYDQVYARLEVLSLATWLDTASMPEEVAPHFVNLMADNLLNHYSVSNDLYTRIKNEVGKDGNDSVRQIRRMLRPSYASQDEPEDF